MSEKEVCGCCRKTADRSEEECKRLIHRLNRNEGQIRGIRKMVEKAVSGVRGVTSCYVSLLTNSMGVDEKSPA